MTTMTDWPAKPRDMQNHHIDSCFSNDFAFRDDAMIIASYAGSAPDGCSKSSAVELAKTSSQQVEFESVLGANMAP